MYSRTPKLRIRQQHALDLRMAGHTWDQVAQLAGYATKSDAYRAVQTLLSRREVESVDALRAVENDRLDALQLAMWTAAVEAKDLGAQKQIIRIMERRAKLNGLDAPMRTEVTGAAGGPVQMEDVSLSDEQRISRLAALLDAARARRDRPADSE